MRARSPVVFFINGIGDHVLALPALRGLGRLYGSTLTIVGAEFAEESFLRPIAAGRVITVEMLDGPIGRHFDAADVAARIGECDLLVSLNPWHSEAVDDLLARVKPRRSVGFFPGFTTVLPLDFDMHSADLAFSPARFLDDTLTLEDFAQPPALPARASRRAATLRSMLPGAAKVLAVHADTHHTKMWPAETIRRGIHEFLEWRPDYWAFVVGWHDIRLELGSCADRVIACCGTPLETSMAIVSAADLFCGVDSSMLHVADLCRVPTVGLFRATNPREFGCRFARHQHLDLSCDGDAIAAGLLDLSVPAPAAGAAVV